MGIPVSQRSSLDYILITSKWKSSVTNCEAYSSIATVKSDHHIIINQVWSSLRSKIKLKKPPKYAWSIFRTSGNIRLAYRLKIQNHFEILENDPELVLKSFSSILNHRGSQTCNKPLCSQ